MKCMVNGCTNTDEQGTGLYMNIQRYKEEVRGWSTNECFYPAWICISCFGGMNGDCCSKYSQVVRNVEKIKESI